MVLFRNVCSIGLNAFRLNWSQIGALKKGQWLV